MRSRLFRVWFVIIAVAVTGMGASWGVLGAGAQDDVETETFDVASFDAIELQGAGQVVILIGDTPAVQVTADRRAMGFIDVGVEDGTLEAGFPASLVLDVAGFRPIEYVITTPSLHEIHLNGAFSATLDALQTDSLVLGLTTAATLTITDLEAATLEAKLDLASTATLAGSVDSQSVEVVNASTYNAADLDSATAEMTVSEASTATVRVRDSLTGSVTTASTLSYISEDATVDVDTSLLGSVEELPFSPLPGATPAVIEAATPEATEAAAAEPANVDIAISQFLFDPQTVEIPVGTSVTWTNLDRFVHDVALLPAGSGFQSPPIPQNGTFSHTFDQVGTFDYFCPTHPNMFGQIVVVDA
jgi:plastocyanin